MLNWKQIKKELLKPITALDDTKSVRALLQDNFVLIGQAYQLSEAELLRIPNYGRRSLTVFQEYIKGTGLSPLIKYTPQIKGGEVRTINPPSKKLILVDDPIERSRMIALDTLPKFPAASKKVRLFGESDSWSYKSDKPATLTQAFYRYRDGYHRFLERKKDTVIALASPQQHEASVALVPPQKNVLLFPSQIVANEAEVGAMLDEVIAHLRAGGPSPKVQAFTAAATTDTMGQKLIRAIAEHVVAHGPNKGGGPT